MGSKNRILLGVITSQILHYHRNIFKSKKLFIGNKKTNKIIIDHPKQSIYITQHNFQILLDNCIASCFYKEKGVINFITFINEEYLIFGISTNNFYNELATIFKPSRRQLIKCKSSIIFFNNKSKEDFENYLN